MLAHPPSNWPARMDDPNRPGAFMATIIAALIGAAIWIILFALLGLL